MMKRPGSERPPRFKAPRSGRSAGRGRSHRARDRRACLYNLQGYPLCSTNAQPRVRAGIGPWMPASGREAGFRNGGRLRDAGCFVESSWRMLKRFAPPVGTWWSKVDIPDLYPGPRTCARDRTTLTCAAAGPASLRTQRRRGWRAQTLRKWLIPAGSLACVLVPRRLRRKGTFRRSQG